METAPRYRVRLFHGHANFVIDRNNKYDDLAETSCSRGNRGVRQDYVSIYDGQLKLVGEIDIPGRLISRCKIAAMFYISADGRFGYVFNMQPAVSVSVVDLQSKKTLKRRGNSRVRSRSIRSDRVDSPPCVQTVRSRWYAANLANTVLRDPKCSSIRRSTRSTKESLVDRQTGKALFITYTGRILPVTPGASRSSTRLASLERASGLQPASTATGGSRRRPGEAFCRMAQIQWPLVCTDARGTHLVCTRSPALSCGYSIPMHASAWRASRSRRQPPR